MRAGLDVTVTDESAAIAAVALQGPFSRDVLEAAAEASFADLRYFRRRATTIAGVTVDVSRTGYTGDLGYEIWIPADKRDQGLGRGSWRSASPGRSARPACWRST